ncbi:MAG: DUF835 domain-containing protein [Candidatus Thorarchaeota archaeon]
MGEEILGLANKPSLTQYFFFNIKSGIKYNHQTIDEAEVLWDSLYNIYNLQGSVPEIVQSLSNLNQEEIADSSFHQLGFVSRSDESVAAKQLLFNDILIFIINLTTSVNYETETPESDWEQQLEIEITTRDFKNVLGKSSVLQTYSRDYDDILFNVRMKMPFAQNQTIQYCILDFGQFCRFGSDDYYLMVIDPSLLQERKLENLMVNDFPYILSLSLMIKQNYKLFNRYKYKLADIQKQIEQHNKELDNLTNETDPIMLAIRKDHMNEVGKDALAIKTGFKECADGLDLYLNKFEAAVNNLNLVQDSLFETDVRKFQQLQNDIQKVTDNSNELFEQIKMDVENYSNLITLLIRKLETLEDNSIDKSKPYSSSVTKEILSLEKSPYERIKKEFSISATSEPELLDTIPLEWCSSYIFHEPKPSRSLKVFSDLVTKRFMGLCITLEDRGKIAEKYKIDDSSIYQITNETGVQSVPPVLSKISHMINEFISNNIHSVIYMDGIEYLINYNDFDRVLKFCDNIKESIVLNDSILFFSMKGSTLDQNELARLTENSIDLTKSDVDFDDLILT